MQKSAKAGDEKANFVDVDGGSGGMPWNIEYYTYSV
jgi:hypothetical protein